VNKLIHNGGIFGAAYACVIF